jgi:hypothetical protein
LDFRLRHRRWHLHRPQVRDRKRCHHFSRLGLDLDLKKTRVLMRIQSSAGCGWQSWRADN